MTRKVVGFDTETYRTVEFPAIRKKVSCSVVPRMVCLTAHDGRRTELLRGNKAVDQYLYWLDHGTRLVSHNLHYDTMVMVRAAWEFRGRDILEQTFEAYERGQFNCTRVREQLLDNCSVELKDHGYPLDRCVKKHFREDISHLKKGDDVWRKRYDELEPWPTNSWPEEAVTYARQDAEWHYRVYRAQQEPHYDCLNNCVSSEDFVQNEHIQVMRMFALSLMSANGLRVDIDWARKVEAKYLALQGDLRTKLQGYGVLRENGSENKKETQRVFESAFLQLGEEPAKTNPSTKFPDGQIATNAAARTKLEDLYDERDDLTMDPRFALLSLWNRLSKFQSTYIEPAILAYPWSVCTRFDFVATGRNSSSKPNLQNLPKRDRPEDPFKASDIRRMFIPRDGLVFVDADYSTLELRTFAQNCLNLGFHSEMALSILQGRDLHTDFAAQLDGQDYESFKLLVESGDKHAKALRSLSKISNFGYPGGLGASAFVKYARGFGEKVDIHRSTELRQAHRDRWPEMQQFMDYVRDLKIPGEHRTLTGELYGVPQHGPNRQVNGWRTRACDRYTSACNTHFQGLAADGCSLALWKIVRACYTDQQSPLYGFRPCMFIHDQFLLEGPEDGASAAAYELVKLMREGVQPFVPDLPITAEVGIGRRWDVDMKSEVLPDGSLSIYEGAAE